MVRDITNGRFWRKKKNIPDNAPAPADPYADVRAKSDIGGVAAVPKEATIYGSSMTGGGGGGTVPAWHANPNWVPAGNSGEAAVAGLSTNPSSGAYVLEQRSGEAQGSTIFRMSDGTYKTYSSADKGQLTDAGTWNSGEWNDSKYATEKIPLAPGGNTEGGEQNEPVPAHGMGTPSGTTVPQGLDPAVEAAIENEAITTSSSHSQSRSAEPGPTVFGGHPMDIDGERLVSETKVVTTAAPVDHKPANIEEVQSEDATDPFAHHKKRGLYEDLDPGLGAFNTDSKDG